MLRGVCVCQGEDPTLHKHYGEPPHACARCGACDAFSAAVFQQKVIARCQHRKRSVCLRCELKEAHSLISTLVYWHDNGGHIDESWWDAAREAAKNAP